MLARGPRPRPPRPARSADRPAAEAGGGDGLMESGSGANPGGLGVVLTILQSEDRLAGVEQAGLKANAGIVRAGARVGIDGRGRQDLVRSGCGGPVARCRAAGKASGECQDEPARNGRNTS